MKFVHNFFHLKTTHY